MEPFAPTPDRREDPDEPERKEQETGSGRAADRQRPNEDRRKESVKLVLEVAVLALVIYVFIFQISIVKGQSMLPSFAEADRLVIDKLTYRFADVKRFDVIVFRVPKAKQKDYIKRVVALPGETVELRAGALYINGRYVAQDFAFRNLVALNFGAQEVAPGHYFVLGDNRPASTDSRRENLVGQVPAANIRGRVRLRVWPLHKLSIF